MPTPRSFVIGDDSFLLDGEPFRILAGAIHYFRVHPDQWRDRIRAARQMGLNTIETYIAWNFHSPEPGRFDLSGRRDVGAFLDAIADEGMLAIVRPGPYICAEWDNGGLPTWLTREEGVRLRSSDPRFLAPLAEYLSQIAPVIGPRLIGAGGPVILMQVENEYGAYGDDAAYLQRLVELYRQNGFDVPLTTVDQPEQEMLRNGRTPGVHMTGSFGSKATKRFDAIRAFQPTGPLMCSEFWDGWFDSWGQPHHTTSAAAAAAELDAILASGGSVNIYMFHGGTNFGLTNGANHKGMYVPIATSYDYDAPLSESGAPTDKYWAFREVIGRYAPLPADPPARTEEDAPSVDAAFTATAGWRVLLETSLTRVVDQVRPPTFDDLLHSGFLLYRHRLEGPIPGDTVLVIDQVRDRALVSIGGTPLGRLDRDAGESTLRVPSGASGWLEILVEDLGRVDYGPRLGEWKGIGTVSIGGVPLSGWEAIPVSATAPETPLRDCTPVDDPDLPVAGPVVASGRLVLDRAADAYLSTDGWGKGIAWVNGFCLGRYWSRGPSRTLYVPAPVTRAGENTVTVFDTVGLVPRLRLVPRHDLGFTDI